jgi:phosphoenolpyruvate---glycerone phosphotransferase subunit DhaL
VTGLDFQSGIERAAKRLLEITDLLNQLDGAMGDGDTGVSVAKGAQGVLDHLNANPVGDDLGKWLAGVGMAYNRAAPSTMGALVATGLMRAGKEAMGVTSLDAATLARMMVAANVGIQERGKAKPGDKTLVDALHPAAEAFSNAVNAGSSLEDASDAMLTAARKGRDAAIPLRSMIGRANWVGGTEGKVDPGTVLLVSVLEAILQVPPSAPGSTVS